MLAGGSFSCWFLLNKIVPVSCSINIADFAFSARFGTPSDSAAATYIATRLLNKIKHAKNKGK